jgi:pyruvate dehydrogenase kinase 2/3/4
MKAARLVMRGASSLSSANLVPREVELFSRYSPSPLSMKQLLDFGERGRESRPGREGCGLA